MFFSIFGFTAANLIYLVLHVTNSGSFPRPLSADEEKHYLNLLKKGDENARNVLIERNLRLVAHIIKKYYANARDQDDLISIGTIGLIKAVSTFDSDKGTRLATYAARCIENAMLTLRKHFMHTTWTFSNEIPTLQRLVVGSAITV
jgi:RNA polymerase sporulation-specific sigma factor